MSNAEPGTPLMDIAIVLSGPAGQGINTVERMLTVFFKRQGYHVFASPEFMSRIRGGMNSSLIRMSDRPVNAYCDRIDILVSLDKGGIRHLGKRLSSQTVVLGDRSLFDETELGLCDQFIDVPIKAVAGELQNKIYANMVAAGALLGVLGVSWQAVADFMAGYFKNKPADIVHNNSLAAQKGHEAGKSGVGKTDWLAGLKAGKLAKDQILINGSEAVGLGAIAGGCRFIASYPMSPGTGVLTFLAQKGRSFDMVVEQAEDEIAAINMALGAWYAGARALVTTSGGGFALMGEGISLAGMIESPAVVHIAQRPGPATGLPTRTEQGDLDLVLYAGHGEFPRIILAPGTLEDGFYLTAMAFEMADKFQVPVFILTDQYFVDSSYNVAPFVTEGLCGQPEIVKTAADYRRYALTESGLSPRGIPGWGDGLVAVDSDEHDEAGHITEDLDLRVRMVDKRLKKLALIQEDLVPPRIDGLDEFDNLILCWGSTYPVIREAVALAGSMNTTILHLTQVYPIHELVADYAGRANKVIVIEGNGTGQLARLLKTYADINVDATILKYDGLNFAADTLASQLSDLLIKEEEEA